MTKKCKVCGKSLPRDSKLDFCSKECMEKYKEKRVETFTLTKTDKKDEYWVGQRRRKRVVEIIIEIAKQNCPMSIKKFASLVSYKTGLSLRKIRDDYLEVLLDVGILKEKNGILALAEESEKSG